MADVVKRWFVLSYDAINYDGDAKRDITEMFLDFKPFLIESYTDSTIHFSFNAIGDQNEVLQSLSRGIKELFPEFRFSLTAIALDNDGNPFFINDDPKHPLKEAYDELVVKLKAEKLS